MSRVFIEIALNRKAKQQKEKVKFAYVLFKSWPNCVFNYPQYHGDAFPTNIPGEETFPIIA